MSTAPYLDAASNNAAAWLLRLAMHPAIGRRILGDAQMFSVFFAALKPRVRWTTQVEAIINGGSPRPGDVKFDAHAFEAWKKSEENPFLGKISSLYLEDLFQGIKLYSKFKRREASWNEAIVALHDNLPNAHASDDTSLSAPRLRDTTAALPPHGPSLFHTNLEVFNWIVPMLPAERDLLELGFLLSNDESIRFLFDTATHSAISWRTMLETMLDLDPDTLGEITSSRATLMLSGLLSIDQASRRVFPLSDFWHTWFQTPYPTLAAMFGKLVSPMTRRPSAGAMGRIHATDRSIVSDLLVRPRFFDDRPGLNVLLYGPRSIDKAGLVLDILSAIRLPALTLGCDIPDRDLGSVAYVAQRYVAKTAPNSVLVLQPADQVLTRTRRGLKSFAFFSVEMDEDIEDAAMDAALLTDNPAKTLWLVNSPERLSEDNLGRFLYVSEVRAASRAERLTEINTIFGTLDIGKDLRKELSHHLRLSEQQLRSARRLVDELSTPGPLAWAPDGVKLHSRAHREVLVRRTIDQSQRAMNRRDREHLRQPVTTYSLDLLNLSSSFSIPQIIQSLKHRQSGSMCFYGLPGTGKTQLAEYIAVNLDRPIIMKRASELTDKFVGESEKNIRAMFDEAAEEDAVLFLDEADTFLMDRARATHTWETSSVNEMLQSMERFRGIFICATNLFETIDRAALRRFTFKLQFNALSESQRWDMLCNEANLSPSDFTPAAIERIKNDLLMMYELTPGDFATIKRQIDLLGQPLSLEEWLLALNNEAEFKRRAEQRQSSSAQGHFPRQA